jgi:hypothetical protein
MLTVIVAGRNDDYGKNFKQRLFRTAAHNAALLSDAGVEFEYLLAEWNPLPDRPLLSTEFVQRVPNARAVVIPECVHEGYTLNPQMPFHEMAAKNAALRRAQSEVLIVTNADILFSEELVDRIAAAGWAGDTLYRAHRIDVRPELHWNEIRNPQNQLASGEGRLAPPYYLGAGGDFCLARRELWHRLRGFNERIRFSTRAKDWQFFLSAAAQNVGVEFIGDVYHLDHEGGFRNTCAAELNSESVHFGRWWDIEFGLPVRGGSDWGFSTLKEAALNNDERIVCLEANDGVCGKHPVSDQEMMAWLTRPPGCADASAAFLLHAICAAHREKRRLIIRFNDPRLAVTLAGFDAVASRFQVEIRCNWQWPDLDGYTVHDFLPEPATLRAEDWVLEDTGSGIRAYESGSGSEIAVLPAAIPVREPEFNPMLARRLLYAYLRLQTKRVKRIIICGAGGHTRGLLRWGLPDAIELAGIVRSEDIRCDADANDAAILLSSASFESDMAQVCRDRGIQNVIALYGDWPLDVWPDTGNPSRKVYA